MKNEFLAETVKPESFTSLTPLQAKQYKQIVNDYNVAAWQFCSLQTYIENKMQIAIANKKPIGDLIDIANFVQNDF